MSAAGGRFFSLRLSFTLHSGRIYLFPPAGMPIALQQLNIVKIWMSANGRRNYMIFFTRYSFLHSYRQIRKYIAHRYDLRCGGDGDGPFDVVYITQKIITLNALNMLDGTYSFISNVS